MSSFLQSIVNWYSAFFLRVFNIEKRFHILDIDFQKPWWNVYLQQKWRMLSMILSEAIQAAYSGYMPILVGYAVAQRNWSVIWWIVGGYVVLEFLNRIVLQLYSLMVMTTELSMKYNTQKYFLTVDPINHTSKSSGQILNKVQSASKDMVNFMDSALHSILPTISSFMASLVAFAQFDGQLTLVALALIIITTAVFSFFSYLNSKAYSQQVITTSDAINMVTVENLIRNDFIRATFATSNQLSVLNKRIFNHVKVRGVKRWSFGVGIAIARLLWILSLAILSGMVINLITESRISTEIGLALLATYIATSRPVLRVGDIVGQMLDYAENSRDLFVFIRNFGKQTYPVLENDTIITK